jgi:hypothetical protein
LSVDILAEGIKNITASYPIIANVSQTYDNINERTKISFSVIDNKNPIYSIIDETYLRNTLYDWTF